MKRFIPIFIITLAIISCNKDTMPVNSSGSIAGKWRYTQYYYSIGGPPIYVSTVNTGQWIKFNSDGSFSGNVPKFADFKRYEIVNPSTIKFITPQQAGFRLYYLSLDSNHNSMTLSPADYICIEGCGDIFKREGL
jgi:hypothetical protein